MPVYRYAMTGVNPQLVSKSVAGALTFGSLSPAVFHDVTAASGDKADLDEAMARFGFTYDSTDPITNVATAAQGLNSTQLKQSCRAATTGALPSLTYANGTSGVGATLTATANAALAAQDGVTLVANDRLLVKNQASGLQNGIYVVTQVGSVSLPFILTRALDSDLNAVDVVANIMTFIEEGTTLADSCWILTTNNPITVGTTLLTFTQFGVGGSGLATQDEGVGIGTATTLNFVGAGVTATFGSGTTTVTIPGGGGGSANSGSATLDFGAKSRDAKITVTGQTGILSTSTVYVFFQGSDTTASHGGDEHALAALAIDIAATNISVGVGFDILGFANCGFEQGTYKVRYIWV